MSLQGLLRTAEQLKIKGLCETAETVDEILPETATTITLPETVVIGGHHQQQTQQQIVHTISNAANTNIGTIVATAPTTSRKSRLGKRSKSPEQLHQQQQQQQQTILTTSQTITGPAIVSLHQTSSGSYIPVSVSGQPITTTTAITNNPHTNNSDSENKVIQAKICKTDGGNHNNNNNNNNNNIATSSGSSSGSSTVSVSSGGGGATPNTSQATASSSSSAVTVATSSSAAAGSGTNNNGNSGGTNSVAQQQQQTGTAIVAQIVVRDGKDKNMTSLGMGMVRIFDDLGKISLATHLLTKKNNTQFI